MFTLQFNSYEFPNQTFEIDGFGLTNGVKSNTITRKSGGVILRPYLKSQRFKIKGQIHSSDQATARTQIREIQTALAEVSELGNFKYREDRYLKCYMRKFEAKQNRGSDLRIYGVDIQMEGDPYYQSVEEYTVVHAVAAGTIEFNVDNDGDLLTDPVISIYAPGETISDNLQLTNESNSDQIFKFRGSLVGGNTLAIDSDELTVLNNAADGLSYYKGDFISLVAGSNTFQWVGGEANITVTHRRRYYA